jgi:hypothetical protein
MNLWFRVALRILARALDFAWTGALTMFVVGAVSGIATGSLHLVLSRLLSMDKSPILAILFGTFIGAGLFGAVCGAFSYGIAGAVSSRHADVEQVIQSINRWIFHCGVVGMVGGYLNGLLYLMARQKMESREFPIFDLLSLNALEGCAAAGFFLLTFLCTILGARKAMREMDAEL